MTLQQITDKYGKVKLKFSSYYKYEFTFIGITCDGEVVKASIGGDPDDIYRMEICRDTEITIKQEGPNYIQIIRNGETIVEWNNW